MDLLTIMYAPCMYAHPDHLRANDLPLDRLPGSLANQVLIDHLMLETRIDWPFDVDPDVQRCIMHWARLPRICFLMGARRLRAALVAQGRYICLDPLAQRFACLPLVVKNSAPRSPEAQDFDVFAAGTICIADALRRLPWPLTQRLFLLFPKVFIPQLRAQLDGNAVPRVCHPSLFSFAVSYALFDSTPLSR